MNRKTLRKVAKIHGVSVAEVKSGIQDAIDEAYKEPNYHARSAIKHIGEKPTVDEMIEHITQETKKRLDK